MNSKRYWKNRLPFLLTNLVCMAALTVFLLVCGNSVSAVVLILIVWALVLLTGLRNADTLHHAKEWITMANKEKRFETIYTQGTSLSIVVDTETGVNYLVHDTGITPLLDKNGTVVITEINK